MNADEAVTSEPTLLPTEDSNKDPSNTITNSNSTLLSSPPTQEKWTSLIIIASLSTMSIGLLIAGYSYMKRGRSGYIELINLEKVEPKQYHNRY